MREGFFGGLFKKGEERNKEVNPNKGLGTGTSISPQEGQGDFNKPEDEYPKGSSDYPMSHKKNYKDISEYSVEDDLGITEEQLKEEQAEAHEEMIYNEQMEEEKNNTGEIPLDEYRKLEGYKNEEEMDEEKISTKYEEVDSKHEDIIEQFDTKTSSKEGKQKSRQEYEREDKKYRNRTKRGNRLHKRSNKQLYNEQRKHAEQNKEDTIAA